MKVVKIRNVGYYFKTMAERTEVNRVELPHLIELIDPVGVLESVSDSDNPVSPFAHKAEVYYKDRLTGGNRLLVIRSDDQRLVEEMSQAARQLGDEVVTEEQLRQRLSIYTSRLPVANISYDEQGCSHINCEEPSCRYYIGGGCTNENVMIQDDCGETQWCMTYEPAEESI